MSKSYVLVVATHSDDPQCTPAFVRQKIQDFTKFQQRFRSIRSCAAVSCSSGEGIANLRLALQQVAHEHYLLNKLVPGKWETLDSKIKFIRRKAAYVRFLDAAQLEWRNWPHRHCRFTFS